MTRLNLGGPGDIDPVEVECRIDEFENAIRKIGVVNACEWFGHASDSMFIREIIKLLVERTEADKKAKESKL